MSCDPGNESPYVADRGVVALNTWRLPQYRRLEGVEADWGVAEEFFGWVFRRPEEREKILD